MKNGAPFLAAPDFLRRVFSMPRRDDLRKKILLIGSGPIIIGQACEFDYFWNPSVQVRPRSGFRGSPRQLQSRHYHDGPRAR
jgi:hypothetical protein